MRSVGGVHGTSPPWKLLPAERVGSAGPASSRQLPAMIALPMAIEQLRAQSGRLVVWQRRGVMDSRRGQLCLLRVPGQGVNETRCYFEPSNSQEQLRGGGC